MLTPIYSLIFVVDHYGYVYYENGVLTDLAKAKGERNLSLLLNELEKMEANGTVNTVAYSQLSDCYATLGDMDKALEYLKKGYEITDPKSISILIYYNKLADALLTSGHNDEAVELCDKYFSKKML